MLERMLIDMEDVPWSICLISLFSGVVSTEAAMVLDLPDGNDSHAHA